VADLLHRDYPHTLPPEGIAHREEQFIRAARRAQFFQCNSRFVVERLGHHFVIPAARTFHTYNVIHDRLDHAGPGVLPPALEGRPYLFYPANAWVHKNHEGLLIAYRTYRMQRGSDAWPLVLSGHHDERFATIRRWARALGLAESVHFVGHVPEAELSALWRHAGALIFPSLHEGFGIPLVEAMHFGIPMAASNCCSVPEIAGDAALYFDPCRPDAMAAAMQRVAHDSDLRDRLVAASALQIEILCADDGLQKLADHLYAAADAWPEADSAGAYLDGWISGLLVLGLPPSARAGGELQIDYVDHAPKARLTIDAGHRPLGTFALRDFPGGQIRLALPPGARVVELRVLGGENLNPADARIHGLRVHQVEFHPSSVPTQEVIFRALQ
jgi:hypothetical protein